MDIGEFRGVVSRIARSEGIFPHVDAIRTTAGFEGAPPRPALLPFRHVPDAHMSRARLREDSSDTGKLGTLRSRQGSSLINQSTGVSMQTVMRKTGRFP